LMLISGTMIAIALGECFQNLNWNFRPRVLAIGLCNYLLYYLLNLLDGLLFTPLPRMTTGISFGSLPHLLRRSGFRLVMATSRGGPPGGKNHHSLFLRPPMARVGMAISGRMGDLSADLLRDRAGCGALYPSLL